MRIAPLLAAALTALPALAQSPEEIKEAVGVRDPGLAGNLLSGLGSFGKIDEDWFLFLTVRMDLDLGKVGLGLQAPLRIRVLDNDPKNPDDYGDVIREEDWDEASDYMKIIRYVRYGRKGDPIYGTFGELRAANIGHRTIVHRYYNNVEADHYRTGLAADINTDWGGFEALAGDLAGTGLFAGRGYIRPWSFVDRDSWWKKFGIGMTVATDFSAPYELEDDNGQPVRNLATQVPAVDNDGNLEVADRRKATVIGWDLEFKVLEQENLKLTPYIDLNHVSGGGTGLHNGALLDLHIPVLNVNLEARAELRTFDGDYIPDYFDTFYEVQRYSYPFKDKAGLFGLPPGSEARSVPKRRVVEVLDEDDHLNGWFGEANLDFLGLLAVGGSYDDYEGPLNSNLRVFLDVPSLEVFKFQCYYYKSNFDTLGEAFTFDERSLFLMEGRYPLALNLDLQVRYWRVWRLNGEGRYEPVDDWSVGIVFDMPF